MSPIWVFLLWYAFGAVLTTAVAIVCMVREGEIRLKDAIATFLLAGVFWPVGVILLVGYYADNIDWDRSLWESEEHKRSKGRVFYTRSEDD